MLTVQTAALIKHFIAAAIAYFLIAMISGYAQAWIAKKLGDTTAESFGFLSLNPAVHVDGVGFFLFLITGFGWGKIVPINPFNFSGRYRRFEIFFAQASRPLVTGMLGLCTLCVLDIFCGGYVLPLPTPFFYSSHLAFGQALKSILILMTTFSIFFSLYSTVLMLFKIFILQLLGPMNIVQYEAELLATLLAIFMLIFFSSQIEYLVRFIVIHLELCIWYWWYTLVQFFGFVTWYA